jgi:hypothetical protein
MALRAVQMGPEEGAEADAEPTVLPTDAEIAAEPGGLPVATLALIEAAAKAQESAPTTDTYEDKTIGASFTFRAITGDELAACRKLATVTRMVGKPAMAHREVDNDRLNFLLVNRASVTPKVTDAMWAALGRCGAMVQSNLSAFVLQVNGIGQEGVEDAGKDSTANPS